MADYKADEIDRPDREWDADRQADKFAKPCSIPVAEQLAEIAKLEDGWDCGEGVGYDTALTDRASAIITAIVEAGAPIPYTYPNSLGGFSLEWDGPRWAVTLKLASDLVGCEIFAIDMTSDQACWTSTVAQYADSIAEHVNRVLAL